MNLGKSTIQKIATLLLYSGSCMVTQQGWSALHTTPYIAVHSQPKYAGLKVMPYANVHAPKGGYISMAANGTFDNLNTMNGKGSATDGVNYLFDTLMDNSLDEPGVMYPLLADKVSFDPNKPQFIIFHLNPKARFSNGTAVTAEDVKFSFDAYQNKANLGLQMYLSNLAKTEVLSKFQVKFSFKSAKNKEMPLIVASLPIYSQQDWRNKDFTRITMQPILGSGPYLIERIDAGRSITYKRNPRYWAKDLMINRGRYNFDRIQYVYYRNADIAFEGFKSGQYTLHEEKKTQNWVTAYQFPAVQAGIVKKYKHRLARPVVTQSLVLNTRKAPLNDIYFRQALSYAYDFEWLNKALFYGQYQRLQSHFQNSELAATGQPSVAELKLLRPYLTQLHPLQRQGVLTNWQYPVSDAGGFNRPNLLRARNILLKAGYFYRQGQLYARNGKPVQFEILTDKEGAQRTLMPWIRYLKKLGMNVTLHQVDVSQYMERMRRYQFDVTTMEMPQSLSPGSEQAQMWSSSAARELGNYNYSGIQNAAIDAAVQQVIQAPNREQLVLRTRVLDRLLRAGYYQILTYGKNDNWYAYWNMYQQPAVKPKLSLGLDYWWSDPVQAKKVSQYLRQ